MKCQDAQLLLSELLKRELTQPREAALRLHLDGCAACAAQEAQERALWGLLQQNPLEAPLGLSFSMMPDRVWEGLAAKRRKRRAWYSLGGLFAAAALLLFLFSWASPTSLSSPSPTLLPVLSAEELASVEEALEAQEQTPLGELFEPVDLSELDEEGIDRFKERLSQELPQASPLEQEDDYFDELDELSAEELDRLNNLIELQKKG